MEKSVENFNKALENLKAAKDEVIETISKVLNVPVDHIDIDPHPLPECDMVIKVNMQGIGFVFTNNLDNMANLFDRDTLRVQVVDNTLKLY